MRLNDIIDEAPHSHRKRIAKLIHVLLLILCCVFLSSVENRDCTFRTHYGDFRRRPSIIDIGFQVLRAHHIIGTTISFASDHRYFWHCCLCKSVQQLGSVTNDSPVLLSSSRKKACRKRTMINLAATLSVILPGTSTKVMIGMLKASQKRTKRAPFTEEFMSKQPSHRWD